MKTMRKIASLLLALVMIFGLATTAFAEGESTATYSITINNPVAGHTYEAYQIFTGDLSDDAANDAVAGTSAVLSNIKWGNGVAEYNNAAVVPGTDASAIAKDLNSNTLPAFINKLVLGTTTTDSSYSNGVYTISGLAAGYYLVKDKDSTLNGKDDAYTSFIIEVVENSTVTPKSAKPTVDKQVWDETADAEANAVTGWGETADHAINETFQFKLIATLPSDTDFNAYDTYKVVFTDTMSNGITFEQIDSVTVDGQTVNSGYNCTATENQKGGSWTLTINDITEIEGVNLADGAVVEVIYSAHLNEAAAIGNVANNKNTVYLEYSNNPNVTGGAELGKTTEDHVWVFTYEVNSTKYKNSIAEDNELPGAGFTLYYSTDGTTKGNKVNLVKGTDNIYRPAANGVTEGVTNEMISADDGTFNVKGLDAGTYIMEETTVPAGYNKCDDITIVIRANHAENDTSAETNISLTINNDEATHNNVINNVGSTLPETGGMGTTLLYALGGILVLAAVILLVTKKRMASN